MWRNLELNNKVLRIIIVVMLVAVVLAFIIDKFSTNNELTRKPLH